MNKVVYIASPQPQVIEVDSPEGKLMATLGSINKLYKHAHRDYQNALRLLDFFPWYGWVSCENGEIKKLTVATARSTGRRGPAFECGFGSILAHFCFQNNEHHSIWDRGPNPGIPGYNIGADDRFQQGNMAEIRDGLMSQHCRRIIYVHYETSNRDLRAKGSKALIYAAYAADYNYVIVYNSDPCNDQCCAATNGPCLAEC